MLLPNSRIFSAIAPTQIKLILQSFQALAVVSTSQTPQPRNRIFNVTAQTSYQYRSTSTKLAPAETPATPPTLTTLVTVQVEASRQETTPKLTQ